MMKNIDVYMGGTRNPESEWRNRLVSIFNNNYPDIEYYNPTTQIDKWNFETQVREELNKEHSIVQLYCITPRMLGVFPIAELIDASNKCPNYTIGVLFEEDNGLKFEGELRISVLRVFELAHYHNGAGFARSLEEAADICANIVRNYKLENKSNT